MQGELTRIETLPPDDSAVSILLDDLGITLDSTDTEVLYVRPVDGTEWWLEFHLPSNVFVTTESDCSDGG
jgi:hypothetical protein